MTATVLPFDPSMEVLSVDETVALENKREEEGTPKAELMDRAGAAIAEAVTEMVPVGMPVTVLTGNGNNGGDGWVAADLLAKRGYAVTLITKTKAADLEVEPARSRALAAEESGGFAVVADPDPMIVMALTVASEGIVDALLGTGFDHEQVREPYASWIDSANMAKGGGAVIVAADVPSGMNAQTGKPADHCIEADATVAMLAPKPGLADHAGEPPVGRLYVAPLG